MSEELLFDSDGTIDVEAMVECRETRNVPPNAPPPAAQQGWLDGKAIATLAVSDCIDSQSWLVQAVMRFLIDSANRKNGACYPSNDTIAKAVGCTQRSVQRATRWWRHHGYKVNGEVLPFLSIAVKGREKPDGTKESNAYHIGWLPLIASARDRHYRLRVRRHAAAILKTARNDRCVA
jgi:Helix-turn-helix domain